jgi:transcriptional regulator NrdR family protein
VLPGVREVIACRKCAGKLKCISTRATLAGVTRRYQCHTCALRLSTREQIVAPRVARWSQNEGKGVPA